MAYNDIATKVRMVCAALKVSDAELARRLGMSSQLYSSRMKKSRFSTDEIERIAEALDVKYVSYFELSDGTKI